MPSNVEIKAKIADLEKVKSIAANLSSSEGELIIQQDTFYNVKTGRLKLRKLENNPCSQLIFYQRQNDFGPRRSEYQIVNITETEQLNAALSLALGVKGVVKKKRILYLVDQTRVHVDQVEGLGNFMELEVVLKEGQSDEEGQIIAKDLMEKFDVKHEDLLSGAYMDLLLSLS